MVAIQPAAGKWEFLCGNSRITIFMRLFRDNIMRCLLGSPRYDTYRIHEGCWRVNESPCVVVRGAAGAAGELVTVVVSEGIRARWRN